MYLVSVDPMDKFPDFEILKFSVSNGQKISKVVYGILNSPKKQTKKFDPIVLCYLKSNFFVHDDLLLRFSDLYVWFMTYSNC